MVACCFHNSERQRMKDLIELLRKPSGKVVAQRRIEDAQREYIEYVTMSEQHATMSAHNLNEANRVKHQIDWLRECISQFD